MTTVTMYQVDRRPLTRLVVAFSGGKDSTALALRLHELGHEFEMIHTATGNELPEVRLHIEAVSRRCNAPLVYLDAPTLEELILEQDALPNWRMRWCTRMIKIEPCQEWLIENPGATLAVGLRADEETRGGGVYGDLAQTVYPLRDWGWGEGDVIDYCQTMGADVPNRTDCAVCYYQTLGEWFPLWRNHRQMYLQGMWWERITGHTFRSPSRDTRPAGLSELAGLFRRGYAPTPRRRKTNCRVCSL